MDWASKSADDRAVRSLSRRLIEHLRHWVIAKIASRFVGSRSGADRPISDTAECVTGGLGQ
jgi:hypothetical protein